MTSTAKTDERKPFRVLLADDHAPTRQEMVSLIGRETAATGHAVVGIQLKKTPIEMAFFEVVHPEGVEPPHLAV